VSRRIGIAKAAAAGAALLLILDAAALVAGGAVGVAALAFAAAVAAAVAWLAVQELVAPLRRLLHTTEQVAAGDFTARARGETAVEIDELAAGINVLVASLEQRVATLDASARAQRAAEADAAREREARRVKDEFVATVSDELHAPLTSMSGFLELMLAGEGGDLSAENRRFATATLRSSENLLRVVEDLLLVAQIEAGALELELGEVDILELVAEAVEEGRRAADEAGVTLELDTRGAPAVDGDRGRLAQLLRHLIAYAIEETHRGGLVGVLAEISGDVVVLTIRSTEAVTMNQLQTPFFRVDRADRARVIAGGLAIPIATGIAAAHRGSLVLEPSGESGPAIRVELPAR
jgi:signal transduction histidine kinase